MRADKVQVNALFRTKDGEGTTVKREPHPTRPALRASQDEDGLVRINLLHLPNAERGIAEAFRVLRPGGYFASTVWAKPETILHSASSWARSIVTATRSPAPPYFRFADAEEARRALLAAGFAEPRTRLVPQVWRHASPDQLFDAFNEGAVRATAMLSAQPEHVHQRIKQAVREEVLPLAQDGVYVIAAPVALSSARKPLP